MACPLPAARLSLGVLGVERLSTRQSVIQTAPRREDVDIRALEFVRRIAMKTREGYEGFVIEAHALELKDGGFSAEFFIEEHDGAGGA